MYNKRQILCMYNNLYWKTNWLDLNHESSKISIFYSDQVAQGFLAKLADISPCVRSTFHHRSWGCASSSEGSTDSIEQRNMWLPLQDCKRSFSYLRWRSQSLWSTSYLVGDEWVLPASRWFFFVMLFFLSFVESFFSILEIKHIQLINTVGAQLHGLIKIFLANAVPSRVLTGLSWENPLSQSAVVTMTHILRIVAL